MGVREQRSGWIMILPSHMRCWEIRHISWPAEHAASPPPLSARPSRCRSLAAVISQIEEQVSRLSGAVVNVEFLGVMMSAQEAFKQVQEHVSVESESCRDPSRTPRCAVNRRPLAPPPVQR